VNIHHLEHKELLRTQIDFLHGGIILNFLLRALCQELPLIENGYLSGKLKGNVHIVFDQQDRNRWIEFCERADFEIAFIRV
jgi:hypothetical protein